MILLAVSALLRSLASFVNRCTGFCSELPRLGRPIVSARRPRHLHFAAVAIGFMGLASSLPAQSAHLTTPTQITLHTGFNRPEGVAVDANGNVFVADTGNNVVKEILAAGGYTTVNTLGAPGSFSSPQALTLDANGNLFVADTGNNAVEVLTAADNYFTVTPVVQTNFATLLRPTGVALLKNGNVVAVSTEQSVPGFFFFFDFQYQPGALYPEIYDGSLPTTNVNPGVAVNSAGSIFVSAQSSLTLIYPPDYQYASSFGSGFSNPTGLAVDANGDIFIADTGNNAVKEVFFDGTSYGPIVSLGSGFNQPQGVAVDANGNVFVADTGNNAIKEILAGSANSYFGTVAVGTTTPPTQTYEFTFTTGGSIEAPAVLTQGAAGQDFTDAGTGTCTTNGTSYVYAAGETCTVKVTFTPRHPGTRHGAIQLLNSSGVPFVTTMLSGTGSGPQVTFAPGVQTQIGFGFSAPGGVAVDGNGNVFISDSGNNSVKEITGNTVRTIGTGFSAPGGLAVDGAGDVFVADTGNNAVKQIQAQNGVIPSSPTISVVGSAFSGPTAVAFDTSNNLIVNDAGHSAVKQILASSGYTAVNTVGGTYNYPVLVATDAQGNTYTADTANNRVLMLNSATAPQLDYTSTGVGSTSTDSPKTVTLTNIGNADLSFPVPSYGNNGSLAAGFAFGSSDTCPELSASSSSPATLAAGASCTYSLSFTPTISGAVNGSLVLTDNNLNANSTQTIGLSGTALTTQTITFSALTPVTFGVSPITLSASATSTLPVTFSVLSGPGSITGNVLTVTGAGTILIAADQAGNASYAAAQQVLQSLTVTAATPTITWSNPTSITYGTALSATQLNASLSVAGSCTYTPAAGVVLTVGTQTLSAVCTPTDSTDYATVNKSVSISVTAATPTVTWSTPTSITYGTALSATQLNASLSVAGSCSYTPAAGTVLTAGTHSLSAVCTPTDTTDYATVNKSVSISVTAATPTVTWSTPTSITYGTALSATQRNASLSVAGSCSYTPAAGAQLAAGTQILTATCTPTDTVNYKSPTPATVTLVVSPAPLTIAASSASLVFGAAVPAITPSLTGLVNGDTIASFTTPPVCSTTYTATSAAGLYPTTCSGAVDPNYYITYVAGTITVSLAQQSITFALPVTMVTFGASGTPLTATASSGLPVTFSAHGACAVAGATLLYTSAGACSVVASQPGNADYAAATSVTQSVSIGQAQSTLNWPVPSAIIQGTALSTSQLNATPSVPGTTVYTATPDGGSPTSVSSGTVLTAGTYTLTATFTPTDTNDYTGATASVSLTVNPAPSTIASLSPAFTSAGGSQFTLTVNGTNFTASSQVLWGASVLPTTFVSSSQLTATVSASLTATDGTASIAVLNPAAGSSNSLVFEIATAGATAPTFGSQTVTVTAGTPAIYTVTLPASAKSVVAQCLNLPIGTSCNYSATSNTLTITTSANTPAQTYQVTVVFTELQTTTATAAIFLPFLLVPLFFLRRKLTAARSWLIAAICAALLAGTGLITACGGSTRTLTTNSTQVTSVGIVNLIVK